MPDENWGSDHLGNAIGGINELFSRFWIFATFLFFFGLVCAAIGAVTGVAAKAVALFVLAVVGILIAFVFLRVLLTPSGTKAAAKNSCKFIRANGKQCVNKKLQGEEFCDRHLEKVQLERP